MEWFSCVFLSLYSKQKMPQWAFVNFGWSARIVIPNTVCRAPFTSLALRPEPNNCVVWPNTENTPYKNKKIPARGVFYFLVGAHGFEP